MSTLNDKLCYALADATGITLQREGEVLSGVERKRTHEASFVDFHYNPIAVGHIFPNEKIAVLFVQVTGALCLAVTSEAGVDGKGEFLNQESTIYTRVQILSQAELSSVEASFLNPELLSPEIFSTLTDPFMVREYERTGHAAFLPVSDNLDSDLDEREV